MNRFVGDSIRVISFLRPCDSKLKSVISILKLFDWNEHLLDRPVLLFRQCLSRDLITYLSRYNLSSLI